MKRALLCLLPLAVLALSLIGYFAAREKSVPLPLTVTLRAEACDPLLIRALPDAPLTAMLDGYPCQILSRTVTPHKKRTADGKEYPSRLLYDVSYTVRLEAEEREGVLYGGEKLLTVGKSALLSCDFFEGNVIFLSISRS